MARRRALGVAAATAAGLMVTLQARINGELAVRLEDGIAPAVINFGTGLLLLALMMAGSPTGRRGLRTVRVALRTGQLRWWHCLGGLNGAFLVTTQGLTVATIGVAVFTVSLVAGQSISGVLVDRSGLPPGGAAPANLARMVGSGLCVVAVLVTVADRLSQPQALGLAALPLLAGFGIAWQQAVNGRIRVATGSVSAATLVNFVAGSIGLAVAFGIGVAVQGWPAGTLPTEPWLYLGGLLGVSVIAIAAAVVKTTGVLLLGLATIVGQVLAALAVDLLAPAGPPPAANIYVGAGLALLAVVVATAGSWRGGPRLRSEVAV